MRGRAALVGISLLFAAPMAAAWLAYDVLGWRGDGAAAAGRLVLPARQLPQAWLLPAGGPPPRRAAAVFAGHWTMLQIAPAGCGRACRAALRASRQARALLHVKAARVERVLLLSDNGQPIPTLGLHPDVAIYRTNLGRWLSMAGGEASAAPGTILLIDPAGRWMAFYSRPNRAAALHRDMSRLLASSGGF